MKKLVTAQRNYNRGREFSQRLLDYYKTNPNEYTKDDPYPYSFGAMQSYFNEALNNIDSIAEIDLKYTIQYVEETLELIKSGEEHDAGTELTYILERLVKTRDSLRAIGTKLDQVKEFT